MNKWALVILTILWQTSPKSSPPKKATRKSQCRRSICSTQKSTISQQRLTSLLLSSPNTKKFQYRLTSSSTSRNKKESTSQHCPGRALTRTPPPSPTISTKLIDQFRETSIEGSTLQHRWEQCSRTNLCKTMGDWAMLLIILSKKAKAFAGWTNRCSTVGVSRATLHSNTPE